MSKKIQQVKYFKGYFREGLAKKINDFLSNIEEENITDIIYHVSKIGNDLVWIYYLDEKGTDICNETLKKNNLRLLDEKKELKDRALMFIVAAYFTGLILGALIVGSCLQYEFSQYHSCDAEIHTAIETGYSQCSYNVPLQTEIHEFCNSKGYQSGWISSVNGVDPYCYSVEGEITRAKTFQLAEMTIWKMEVKNG